VPAERASRPESPLFHLALLHPEIPQNAGNIGRLCLGLGARLHLVHPLGFSTDEKAVRRAGLDYWRHVDVMEHPDLDAFLAWASGRRRFLFSGFGGRTLPALPHARDDIYVFGRESTGLPGWWLEHEGAWQIPMTGPIRSLNLSNAAAIVAYQAMTRLHEEAPDPPPRAVC
jgi:tRNA (cytidine/uridine-2'-O-)-methyltransferase